MVDFTKSKEAQQWLEEQPSEVVVPLAARRALRSLPLIVVYQREKPARTFFVEKVLPCFRASAVAWATANFPKEEGALKAAAEAAYTDAMDAYFATPIGTDGVAIAAAEAANLAAGKASDRFFAFYDAYPAEAYADGYMAVAQAAAADSELLEAKGKDERVRAGLALARAPLWPKGTPGPLRLLWPRLKDILLAAKEDWEVWTEWYEDRLTGRSGDRQLEIARALLPDRMWTAGPKVVNAEIRRLINASSGQVAIPAEPIPPQGPGPHFTLGTTGPISLAPPAEIDAEGNNIGRILQLLPLVRRAAGDLLGHLNPNQFQELRRDVADYRAAIADDAAIAWGTVFGLGVMLENAAVAAERHLDDPIWPRLEDAAKTALDSLLTLHGPLVLATAEGRELADEADRMRLTREQQEALRPYAEPLAEALKEDREVIERPAAELVESAVKTIGKGPHAERGTVFGLAAVKNVSIVLVGAAAVTAAATSVSGFMGPAAGTGAGWLSLEALKKSKAFMAAVESLGGEINRIVKLGEGQAELARAQMIARLNALAPFRDFVIRNEEPLRRIAQNTTQMRWMLAYIDYVVLTSTQIDERSVSA